MLQKEKSSFFETVVLNIKNFGIRLLMHCIALIIAIQLTGIDDYNAIFTVFITYIGLICLFGSGIAMHFAWLMPTVIGFVQLLLCFFFGASIVLAIYLGGLQAYIQRIFVKKFQMGIEWILSLFLLIALTVLLPLEKPFFTLISFLILCCLGVFLNKSYAIYIEKQEKIKKLEQERIKSEEEEKNRDPFEDYRKSIKELYPKQAYLPQHLQNTLLQLTLTAEAIIRAMEDDSRDIKAGEKFLTRYLPATHKILDDYKRYCAIASNETVTEALARSEEVLARLSEAFTSEHNYLLRNDIDDFSANLRVLDTLLKMEGR